MPKHCLTWIDSDSRNVDCDSELAGPGADGQFGISHRRWSGGLSDGVDVVTLHNGRFEVSVLPTRGMGLWKGQCDGLRLGWDSPVERPVHPEFVDADRRGGIGWLDGFNEVLCRCGLAWNGAPGDDAGEFLPLHGRIANLPAHHVQAACDGDRLSVRGVVDEATVFGPRLRLTSEISSERDTDVVRLDDSVTNLGGQATEVELLYHTNLGAPFLEEASRFVAPALAVTPRDERAAEDTAGWDRYGGPEAGYAEQVYFVELAADEGGASEVLLMNAAADSAVSLRFGIESLPYFTLWKCTQAEADGYVTGLEPGTDLPNNRSFEREQGRLVRLEPGETLSTWLELRVLSTSAAVSAAVDRIAGMAAGRTPLVHASPRPELSPV